MTFFIKGRILGIYFFAMTSEEILTNLRKIIRALNLESKRIQKEFGVSIPQLLCLNYLYKSSNYQANTKELSNGLTLNASTISGIVTRLVNKGYIYRIPKSGDKRVSYVSLTATGLKMLENTPKLIHQKLDERLEVISAENIRKIKEGLELITHLLGVNEIDAAPLLTTAETPSAVQQAMEKLDTE